MARLKRTAPHLVRLAAGLTTVLAVTSFAVAEAPARHVRPVPAVAPAFAAQLPPSAMPGQCRGRRFASRITRMLQALNGGRTAEFASGFTRAGTFHPKPRFDRNGAQILVTIGRSRIAAAAATLHAVGAGWTAVGVQVRRPPARTPPSARRVGVFFLSSSVSRWGKAIGLRQDTIGFDCRQGRVISWTGRS